MRRLHNPTSSLSFVALRCSLMTQSVGGPSPSPQLQPLLVARRQRSCSGIVAASACALSPSSLAATTTSAADASSSSLGPSSSQQQAPPQRAALDDLLSRLRGMHRRTESTEIHASTTATTTAATAPDQQQSSSGAGPGEQLSSRNDATSTKKRKTSTVPSTTSAAAPTTRPSSSLAGGAPRSDHRRRRHTHMSRHSVPDTSSHRHQTYRRDQNQKHQREAQHHQPHQKQQQQPPQRASPATTPAPVASSPHPPQQQQQQQQQKSDVFVVVHDTDHHHQPVKLRNPFAHAIFPPREPIQWADTIARHPTIEAHRLRVHEGLTAEAVPMTEEGRATAYSAAFLELALRPLGQLLGGLPMEMSTILQWLPFLDAQRLAQGLEMHGAAAQFFVFRNPYLIASTTSPTSSHPSSSQPSSDQAQPAISPPFVDWCVMDASPERFLERFGESLHVSWEPIEIVARRIGFAANVVPTAFFVNYLRAVNTLASKKHPSPCASSSADVLVDIARLDRLADTRGIRMTQAFSATLLTDEGTGQASDESAASPSHHSAFDPEWVIAIRRGQSPLWSMHHKGTDGGDGPPLSVVEITRMLGEPVVGPSAKALRSSMAQFAAAADDDAPASSAAQRFSSPQSTQRRDRDGGSGFSASALATQQYPFFHLGLLIQPRKQPKLAEVIIPSFDDAPSTGSKPSQVSTSTSTVSRSPLASVYRQQAAVTRINTFSVPQRYYVSSAASSSTATAADNRSSSSHNSNHRHSDSRNTSSMQSNTSSYEDASITPTTKLTTRAAATQTTLPLQTLSPKGIHELKVKIVTLKQRARLARGEARTKILEELTASRARLTEALGSSTAPHPPSPPSPPHQRAAVTTAEGDKHMPATSVSPLKESSNTEHEPSSQEVSGAASASSPKRRNGTVQPNEQSSAKFTKPASRRGGAGGGVGGRKRHSFDDGEKQQQRRQRRGGRSNDALAASFRSEMEKQLGL